LAHHLIAVSLLPNLRICRVSGIWKLVKQRLYGESEKPSSNG
jgi:hypothetical protein